MHMGHFFIAWLDFGGFLRIWWLFGESLTGGASG